MHQACFERHLSLVISPLYIDLQRLETAMNCQKPETRLHVSYLLSILVLPLLDPDNVVFKLLYCGTFRLSDRQLSHEEHPETQA